AGGDSAGPLVSEFADYGAGAAKETRPAALGCSRAAGPGRRRGAGNVLVRRRAAGCVYRAVSGATLALGHSGSAPACLVDAPHFGHTEYPKRHRHPLCGSRDRVYGGTVRPATVQRQAVSLMIGKA